MAAAFTAGLGVALATAFRTGLRGTALRATDFFAGVTLPPSLATAVASSSTRAVSAATSLAVGTPSLLIALAVRCSKIDSSLSHCALALAPTSPAIAVIFAVAAPMRSSAALCVFFCRLMPSLISFSKAWVPSACALENAPMPASQICCAESRIVCASWLSSRPAGLAAFFSAIALSFLTM